MAIKVLVLDCQEMFVEGLRSILSTGKSPIEITDSCCEFSVAINLLGHNHYDIILMELNISDINGINILKELEKRGVESKKLILSSYDDPKFVRQAMLEGADGFVSKKGKFAELVEAIEEVSDGGIYIGRGLSTTPKAFDIHNKKKKEPASFQDAFVIKNTLTKRENEILQMITNGKSNKEIGKELYISHQTVGVHRKNIMGKLGISDSNKLIKFALENQLI